jgi:hypothetical protein
MPIYFRTFTRVSYAYSGVKFSENILDSVHKLIKLEETSKYYCVVDV